MAKKRGKTGGARQKAKAAAMDPITIDTLAISIPSPDDSARVLAELAVLNDRALLAQQVYVELKDRTKTAKEKYDELAEQVLTRLRQATHESDLPLFSQELSEADLARMKAGPEGVTEGAGVAPRADLGDEHPKMASVEEIPF